MLLRCAVRGPDELPFCLCPSTADIISTVEFNHTGELLATGDKGGRVVIFQREPEVCWGPVGVGLPLSRTAPLSIPPGCPGWTEGARGHARHAGMGPQHQGRRSTRSAHRPSAEQKFVDGTCVLDPGEQNRTGGAWVQPLIKVPSAWVSWCCPGQSWVEGPGEAGPSAPAGCSLSGVGSFAQPPALAG